MRPDSSDRGTFGIITIVLIAGLFTPDDPALQVVRAPSFSDRENSRDWRGETGLLSTSALKHFCT
jgi:hypothetical protein